MRRGPWWSQKGGGPLAHAVGSSVVSKRRGAPHPCSGGVGGPKTEDAPSLMRWGSRWTQSGGGPLANAGGASVISKRRGPPMQRGPE